jgi:hypothetical protein
MDTHNLIIKLQQAGERYVVFVFFSYSSHKFGSFKLPDVAKNFAAEFLLFAALS